MIRINLLPVREIRAEFSRRQEIAVGSLCLALVLALILAHFFMQRMRVSSLATQLEQVRREIASLNSTARGVGEMERKKKELEGKIKVIDQLKAKRTGPVKMMESLALAIPPRLWLNEFRESGGNLTLSGMAVDNQTVADFLRSLEALPYFGNVELVETSRVDQEGTTLQKFSVRASVIYQAVSDKDGSGKAAEAKGGRRR